ncbi:ParA family protein [Chloroflexota bacterium]
MAHVVAVANPKGGVGKTTSVVNLGVSLARLEKNTLALDFDPQGALSAGLGKATNARKESIYNALLDSRIPLSRIIQPARTYLDLIPANIDLASAEMELLSEIRREYVLRRRLEPLQSQYDVILIDCPPSLGLLSVNALCASQSIVVPLQCEYFALRSIRPLVDAVNKVKAKLNPKLELSVILPTLYSTGTIHSREVLDEIRSEFGDRVFHGVIYKSIRFAEASAAGQAIVEYDPEHKGARTYRELAQTLIHA